MINHPTLLVFLQARGVYLLRCAFVLVFYLLSNHYALAVDIGTAAQYQQQRFEAWGTSLAWMGNEIGGWSSNGPRDQLLDLIFADTNDLGLNFVRYNIGAGQNPNLSINRPAAEIDGWVPNAPTSISNTQTWQWDWNADQTQRYVLDRALANGVNMVEAFSNSAPWWMTISQDSTGAPNQGQSNLAQSNFDEFAYYFGEVVEHFNNNLGIRFETYAPMNEPGAEWWTSPGSQEGMNIPKGTNQALLIQTFGNEMQNRGIDSDLVAIEETSVVDTIDSWTNPAINALTKSYVKQINTHTYSFRGGSGQSSLQQLRNIAEADNKKVFVSEFGTGDSSALDGGITLANRISSDLNILKTHGWTYWQAVEDNNGSGWGLFTSPFSGSQEVFTTRKQYQVMKQFTSYLRPGSVVLENSDSEVTAAYDRRTNRTTLVITNDETSSDSKSFDFLDQSAATTRVIQTSSSKDFESLGPASSSGSNVSVVVPGSSVTTLVVNHGQNLISNPNLELGGSANGAQSITGWQMTGGGFYNFQDNSGDSSEAGALWADNSANSGKAYQTDIGDDKTDLSGVAFELSADVMFQNAGSRTYDAETYLSLEFYGADDQTLVHNSESDFETLINPSINSGFDSAEDSEFRTFRSKRFIAPAGTRYVRPVVRYGNVNGTSTDWVYFDNVFLQEVHPSVDGREWSANGNGNWSDSSNWNGHALVENDNNIIYFGDIINADSEVTLSQNRTVSKLTFFSDHEYSLVGSGALNLAGEPDSEIEVRIGNHQISVDTTLDGDSTIITLAGTSVSFKNSLDLNGNTIKVIGAGSVDFGSDLDLDGGKISSYLAPNSQITIGQGASLNGVLELLISPGQELMLNDEFTLANYGSSSEFFNTINLPSLDIGLAWSIDYGTNALTAKIVDSNSILPGDFNGDGEVDVADYTVWRNNLGATTEDSLNRNGNGSGGVDAADYLVWATNFGNSNPSSSNAQLVSSVPEASTSIFALVTINLYLSVGRGVLSL